MDAKASNSDVNVCKKCNKIVECDNCSSLYQVSCAKLSNIVKFISDRAINFSENFYQPDKDSTVSNFNALEDEANTDQEVNLHCTSIIKYVPNRM